MNQKRSSELEKFKGRVLSHMIKSSVFPPRKALKNVSGQKLIVALETFLHETYRCFKEEMLTYLLQESLSPDILRQERKLIQPQAQPIGEVTVGSMKNYSQSSSPPGVPVASLHLSGSCLEDSGFEIGQKVNVFLGDKELILRRASGFVTVPGQAAGGVTNG